MTCSCSDSVTRTRAKPGKTAIVGEWGMWIECEIRKSEIFHSRNILLFVLITNNIFQRMDKSESNNLQSSSLVDNVSREIRNTNLCSFEWDLLEIYSPKSFNVFCKWGIFLFFSDDLVSLALKYLRFYVFDFSHRLRRKKMLLWFCWLFDIQLANSPKN